MLHFPPEECIIKIPADSRVMQNRKGNNISDGPKKFIKPT